MGRPDRIVIDYDDPDLYDDLTLFENDYENREEALKELLEKADARVSQQNKSDQGTF